MGSFVGVTTDYLLTSPSIPQSLQKYILWAKAREGGSISPSLDLYFSENKNLIDNVSGKKLIDFSRASGGTYVGNDRLIKKATTNYFTNSENSGTKWNIKAGILNPFPENTAYSPDGTLTADSVVETNTSLGHYIERNITIKCNQVFTYSFYVKRIESGESRIIWAHLYANGYADSIRGSYNLDTLETSSNQINGSVLDIGIEPVGDGWFRAWLTGIPTSADVFTLRPRIAFINNSTQYTGVPGTGIYLWGVQLEKSSTLGEYIKTEDAINSAPRFDHDPTTGESLGLLVEEKRTNYWRWSNSATNGETWNNVGSSLNLLSGYQDPEGNTNAILAVDSSTSDPGTTNGVYLQRLNVYTDNIKNVAITYSIWIKPINCPNGLIVLNLFSNTTSNSIGAYFIVNGSSITSLGNLDTNGETVAISHDYKEYPNGWYRCWVTCIMSETSDTTDLRSRINLGQVTTVAGTERFQFYGAQLETAEFPSTYIPNDGDILGSIRESDIAIFTGNNFTSWYNQSTGTVFVNAAAEKTSLIFVADDGSFANRKPQIGAGSLAEIGAAYVRNSDVVGSLSSGIPSGSFKFATAYSNNDYVCCRDGQSIITSSLAQDLPLDVNTGRIGTYHNGGSKMDGHISRLTYWPNRLPNEILQTITQ